MSEEEVQEEGGKWKREEDFSPGPSGGSDCGSRIFFQGSSLLLDDDRTSVPTLTPTAMNTTMIVSTETTPTTTQIHSFREKVRGLQEGPSSPESDTMYFFLLPVVGSLSLMTRLASSDVSPSVEL